MATLSRRRRNNQEVKPWDFDPNPMYACDVDPETGEVHVWMAFDPRYGPESQEQIDWHIKRQTPGSDTWEVGVPCETPGFRAQKKEAVAA